MSSASKAVGGVSEATHSKFFRGVRADALKRYQLLNHIGRGACAPPPLLLLRKAPLTRDCGAADGEVWAACTPGQPNEKVAIKKITQVFSQVTEAKRILRELRILRHLDHPNLIRCARPHARSATSTAGAVRGGSARSHRAPAPRAGSETACTRPPRAPSPTYGYALTTSTSTCAS